MPDKPEWLRGGYKDKQGQLRRLCVAATEQALHDHAKRHGKMIEQTCQMQRTIAVRRLGAPTLHKTVTKFYGLMSV